MRVLIAASLARSLTNFRGELIRALISHGVEVHVTAPDIDTTPGCRETLEAWGVTMHRVALGRAGTNPVSDLGTMLGYLRLCRRIKPDIFLGYTAKPVLYGTLCAWAAGVPRRVALVTGLGFGFQGGAGRGVLRVVMRSFYRAALRFASVVVFQNPDDRRTFAELGLLRAGIPAEVVNGSGVDLEHFGVQPLPDGEITFLMVARLLGDKGVREYVEAARSVRDVRRGARFILVGGLDAHPDSISDRELREWIVSRAIDYRGELADVRPVLGECSVFVLPSYREGTPRAVLEAMATGRPVITTDAPGCRETVVEGVNGFLVEVGSAAAVAVAMTRFLDDPSLVSSMAAASSKIARERFDVRLVNEDMLRFMGVPERAVGHGASRSDGRHDVSAVDSSVRI
jgi:glycosyltransferase involved in cell wall biosynthesis